MEYSDTTALQKIESMNARINIIQGGARAGKTLAMLIILCDLSFEVKDKIIHIVSDSYPNLDNGAMTDWKKLLRGTNRASYFNVNQTTHTWVNICTNTIVRFIACDAQDALGAPRDYLFVNEANRIDYDTFGQLEMRTTGTIWIDFNPVNEFWAMTEIMEKRDDWQFLKLTYLDNEAIPENVLKALLQRKGDGNNNFWRVYGMGEVGSLEGNVYSGWLSSEKPENSKLVRYGLDFGFSNDETAMVEVWECEDGGIWLNQIIYEKGILGSQYPEKLTKAGVEPNVLIVADSARPEIIAEIKSAGFRCIGADKGAGSVKRGIDRVCQRKVLYCPNSKELEREYLTYAWRKKKSTGETIDEPQDGNDHCLPFDTKVDTVNGQQKIGDLAGTKGWVFSEGGVLRFYRNVRQTGVEKILKITLADGRVLRCSSKHPIYTTNRGIVPAYLLNTEDMIQSVTYGAIKSRDNQQQKTEVQRKKLLERVVKRILSKCTTQTAYATSGSVGVSQWENTNRTSDRPYRQKQRQQPDNEPTGCICFGKQPERITKNTGEKATTYGRNTSKDESMACIAGRKKMALGAWQACVSEERASRKKLCSLWEKILYNTVFKKSPLLFGKLQDESEDTSAHGASRKCKRSSVKKALRNLRVRVLFKNEEGRNLLESLSKQKGISIAVAKIEADGIEPVYCMDVFDTSNFSVEGGIIISNCLDAIRYAIDDMSRQKFDF